MTQGCNELGGCTEARLERIYEYLDGVLEADGVDAVRAHLEGCEECRSVYDLECIIRNVVRRSCHDAAPEQLKTRILDRLEEIKDPVQEGSMQESA
ncbi:MULTISPECIES: mycothiol system anti-sigma-R factor [Micrococcaceae]|uniref:Anti-sigma factor (TIGR02949 family) n=2 Tax=Pseudoglutamicibacter albus TaxID=98671 RepID=A0ABU1YZG5_9MICC|nr:MULTISPECIES: mycothiol system anti-sigma-R factor [Micrococcaceae]KGF21351.1 hypothetical protein HMPREF2128_01255 [Pseudoglutamicibacter albus DNF00011]KGF21466.1 hypothetical protein HMPREF2128_01990 [Pseudoglutamicibacter albus DNF00011]MCG7305249.1 mycothiol system anti-sigma-R factor [Pseudoglutamicibacter albus]MDR7293759.1 anti-sigma factor (TIGR02949 family) [Pseudoglutamicibacter albus]OFT24080.1 hypothetical protein HMPREF3175_02060 [Arthrobacter sp. HMSC08H08]